MPPKQDSRTIALQSTYFQTANMGQYSALDGKRVEAHYRAGDMHLSVSGILIAVTSEAVVLEDRFTRGGREKTIRVEIPHAYLLHLREFPESAPAVDTVGAIGGRPT